MALALYVSVGPVITRYGVNVETAELERGEAVSVAENVQYAWPHASGRFLYVASSNSASILGKRSAMVDQSVAVMTSATPGALPPSTNPLSIFSP